MSILLLREKAPLDLYEKSLLSHDYHPLFLPVITHTPVNLDSLTKLLEQTPQDRFWGILATSQRAVETLRLAFNECFEKKGAVDKRAEWLALPFITVGRATAKHARKLGFECFGEETGVATELSRYIIESFIPNYREVKAKIPEKSLLFLSGDKRREVLPTRLGEANIPIHELTVYRTEASSGIALELDNLLSNHPRIDWVVFFSPSGVDMTLEAMQHCGLLSNTRIAAIGPTTRDHLHKLGFPVHLTASKPEPEILAQQVKEYDTQHPLSERD
ncbi:tetrapyrrole biosynthesis, uroporphyrinogen III synthase [Basidiobolus meristosporus CBS 931.73]|uniref:Tetrapyrrole biosynthesis, uroporphyrinogen III synthase n=1 Tax=Basidiobolus meristosporus CBS 931.73 TaxID=1314790 RepID=A0A1Y1Y2J2_9FUNG|nr:tetrapyrrole biosynthesis, uroporphyrinogen III synthase [Basidiobolus meristosporus CBS 931.73]|eukprot:ORX92231.1 tetrapyrrole biosynthesis, uroporphyrinogen III synthase [Basidiobolus meristosporus CBS 931.73]